MFVWIEPLRNVHIAIQIQFLSQKTCSQQCKALQCKALQSKVFLSKVHHANAFGFLFSWEILGSNQ